MFFSLLSFIFSNQQRWSLFKFIPHLINPLSRAPRMHSIPTLLSSILLATGAIAQYGGSYGSGSGGSDSSPDGGADYGVASTSTSSAALSKTITTGPEETSAGGDVKVQVVKVSNKNGNLTFAPNNITAAVGSFVQFHFYPKVSDRSCSPQSIATSLLIASIESFSGAVHIRQPLCTFQERQQTRSNGLLLWFHARQCRCDRTRGLYHPDQRHEAYLVLLFAGKALSRGHGRGYQSVCLPPALTVLEANPIISDLPPINPVQSTHSPHWLRMHPKTYHQT